MFRGGMEQRMNKKLKRRTAFINKFNCEAKYTNLKPTTRNVFERVLELVKSKYFWNTKSQLIDSSRGGNPANGEAYLNIVIDPITQKHANMTVKTPEQLIRFQQIELPIQMRPFPLLRQQNVHQNIQSFGQFLTRQEVESRAECSVDGQTVETFVWIKISSDYRNTQCGLCGHYDDASNDENELLMANNEIAPSLTQFHRSYSLSNSYDNDDKLCNAQELDKFYEENSNKFGYLNEMEGEDEERWEEEERKEENNKLNQNWDEEGFNGNFDEENKYFYNEE
uniref:VWFD domain-containing protein n=1 Tax=Meloidogyne javanica TaxID=6303 RepID=A0A915LX24_MELJA